MQAWQVLVGVYFGYLALLGCFVKIRPGFWRWTPAAACLALPALALPAAVRGPLQTAVLVVLPSIFLVASYWLSGLFFTGPMPAAERVLLGADRWVLSRLGLARLAASGPRWIVEGLELAYLLVYLMVPAGAFVLAAAGHAEALPRYWAVVLAAALASYAMMPWVQTRPPRAIEAEDALRGRALWLRAVNLAVLSRGSHQANTVPSGHAAAALAAALCVAEVLPAVGTAFVALAAAIAIATVVGRYHYAIDTALGIVLAVAAWLVPW
jgi:membrane-associated phospholipid phosphatase